jgi:hypothetical protein
MNMIGKNKLNTIAVGCLNMAVKLALVMAHNARDWLYGFGMFWLLVCEGRESPKVGKLEKSGRKVKAQTFVSFFRTSGLSDDCFKTLSN